jgi:hypothetical protein
MVWYNWNDQIKEDEMSEVCSTRRRCDKRIKNVVGKPEGTRPRSRWSKDNIKTHLKKTRRGLDSDGPPQSPMADVHERLNGMNDPRNPMYIFYNKNQALEIL